jgi:hypothetical protein
MSDHKVGDPVRVNVQGHYYNATIAQVGKGMTGVRVQEGPSEGKSLWRSDEDIFAPKPSS